MKKIGLLTTLVYVLLYGITSASCQNIYFDGGTACVDIYKNGSTYTPSINLPWSNTYAVSCDILLPNDEQRNIGSCNQNFTYNGNGTSYIKLYVRLNDEYKIREGTYDFSQGFFVSQSNGNSNNNGNNNYLNSFSVQTDSSYPNTNQYLSLTIKALNNQWYTFTSYNGTVSVSIEKKDSYSNRYSANSNDFYLDRSSVSFSSSDYGQRSISSAVKFYNNGEYRIKVQDGSIYNYSYVTVGWSSNTNTPSLKNFEITISPSSPRTYDYVNLTLKAMNTQWYTFTNYTGTTSIAIEKKDSYGNRSSASSSDVYLDRSSISFLSSDNGQRSISSALRFYNNGEYRIKVWDSNQTASTSYYYITFTNNQWGNNNNNTNNTPSSVNGFTTDELQKVKNVYAIWDNVVSRVESKYTRLRNNTDRKNESNKVKSNMRDVIDNYSNRTYKTYNDFRNGIANWIYYTNQRK